jgi:hypothetical protein
VITHLIGRGSIKYIPRQERKIPIIIRGIAVFFIFIRMPPYRYSIQYLGGVHEPAGHFKNMQKPNLWINYHGYIDLPCSAWSETIAELVMSAQ